MKAVVTGCAGFVGSHLVERLLEGGWAVVGVDSFAPTYETATRRVIVRELADNPRFEFIQGDINEIDLRPHLPGTDVVFHLAARPGVRASWTDFETTTRVNILGTQRVLEAIATNPATRLVFASSSSVYGPAKRFPTTESDLLSPISPYGVSKAACESLIGAYVSQTGITAVSLRYFTVFGPRQRSDMAFTKWIRAALGGNQLPLYGNGSAIRDFTYVADAVNATIAAATIPADGHEILNVAGGSPARISDVLAIIEDLLDVPLQIEYLPKAKGDPAQTGGDSSRLSQLAGWQPEWSLRDGLAAQIDWLRSAG